MVLCHLCIKFVVVFLGLPNSIGPMAYRYLLLYAVVVLADMLFA